jgi:hypothetical protein
MNAYIAASQHQADQLAAAMQTYDAELAEWREDREPAIQRAENLFGSLFDNFRQVFIGSVAERWVFLGLMQLGLFLLIMLVLKSKDIG